VRETFHYAIPDRLSSQAEVGRRVMVPFRNRKVTGYILNKEEGGQGFELKEILDVLDPEPLFHHGLVPFFKWMADYYLYPLGRLIQSALPGGLNVSTFKTARITEKGKAVLALMPTHSEEKRALNWIKEHPDKKIPFAFEAGLLFQKKGWVVVDEKIRRSRTGPLMRKFVRAKDGLELDRLLTEKPGLLGAKNEMVFLEGILTSDGLPLRDISSQFANGAYLVRKWKKRGVLETYEAPVFRDPTGKEISPTRVPAQLYDQQREVLAVIKAGIEKGSFSTSLLHGVTGSGKTEVYYRAIEHAIQRGRQAILMVPEIALAIYVEGMFRSRLGEKVAVFHSGLSEGERYDQWMSMARGEVDLVIGARSALFAPFPRLGLIIVDEEHDSSYKQEEGARYQARDAAVMRGKMEKALVLLGSGTPSVQSFYNARTGRYQMLTMPDRIESRPLPRVEVIDMKGIAEGSEKEGILSPLLREAMESALGEGKQVMLFLNRRGFNRVCLCRSCGQPVRCSNCDIALTYHLRENRLACHYCGFHCGPRESCPSCGHEDLKAYGFGTERLEKALRELYPDKSIARMDRDSTRRKGHALRLIKRFSRQEIDILVGTQMITKGYDFPNVTLVGVIAADFLLGFPDFRAGERTFQILSQVAGRAGRGDHQGRVIVQTFNPEHYAISTARDHDYEGFFEREKALREQLGYPPFSFLACLRLQGNDKRKTAETAQRMGEIMVGILRRWPKRGEKIRVLGPVEAPLSKLKGKHRWQIFVKSQGAALLHHFLGEVEGLSKGIITSSGVNLIIDVDPYQML